MPKVTSSNPEGVSIFWKIIAKKKYFKEVRDDLPRSEPVLMSPHGGLGQQKFLELVFNKKFQKQKQSLANK